MQTTVRASWATLLNVGVQCWMECAAINMAAWHARQPKKGTEIFFRITIFKHVPSYCEILVLSHHVLVDTSSTKQAREHCCHAIHPWKGVWQQSMRHQLMLDSTFVQSCFEREGTSVKVPRLRWGYFMSLPGFCTQAVQRWVHLRTAEQDAIRAGQPYTCCKLWCVAWTTDG